MSDRLGPGQTLAAGRRLHAPTRPVTLVMRPDGNLVLVKSGAEELWSSETAGKPATHATMRADGNLVVLGHRRTYWSSGTRGHAGASLVVQDDGNLVIYDAGRAPVWASDTVTEWRAPGGDTLRATEALFPGRALTARTRPLRLELQPDGDLVLSRDGVPVWASGIAVVPVTSAVMQEDGDLVLHGPTGTVWASGTAGHPGARLVVRDDGDAVIVDADGAEVWTTNTPIWPPAARFDVLWPPDALALGQALTSPSGLVQLALQGDGNLVLSDSGTAIWASGTAGRPVAQAVMEADGNLVLEGASGIVWATGTGGHPGARLAVQDDGNAVVYDIARRPLWATNTAEHRRRLAFSMQHQEQTNWCWSAVSTSVSHFYNPGSGWTQCGLANAELGQTTCCANGASPQCNVDGYLDRALGRTGNLQSWAGGAIALGRVEQEVNAGRVVGVRIGWAGGGGHFVALAGYADAGSGAGFVSVEDPWYGPSRVSYDSVRTAYQGSGSWTHTYYTRG